MISAIVCSKQYLFTSSLGCIKVCIVISVICEVLFSISFHLPSLYLLHSSLANLLPRFLGPSLLLSFCLSLPLLPSLPASQVWDLISLKEIHSIDNISQSWIRALAYEKRAVSQHIPILSYSIIPYIHSHSPIPRTTCIPPQTTDSIYGKRVIISILSKRLILILEPSTP